MLFRSLRFGNHFAQDMDALGLEPLEMGEARGGNPGVRTVRRSLRHGSGMQHGARFRKTGGAMRSSLCLATNTRRGAPGRLPKRPQIYYQRLTTRNESERPMREGVIDQERDDSAPKAYIFDGWSMVPLEPARYEAPARPEVDRTEPVPA